VAQADCKGDRSLASADQPAEAAYLRNVSEPDDAIVVATREGAHLGISRRERDDVALKARSRLAPRKDRQRECVATGLLSRRAKQGRDEDQDPLA
jgi:hypothetical protein